MKKILIIDDDARYRRVTSELLQTRGWEVLEADDGQSGVELARRHRPDVVLCDLLMPRFNGFNVCRAIRGDVMLRDTKIIVSSGRDYDSDRLAAREAGADEYLPKPVKPDHLMQLLSGLGGTTQILRASAKRTDEVNDLPAQLKFWGVRGSIPTPGPGTVRYGGNTSCIEVRAGGEIIILDAGTGLRRLGMELLHEFKEQPLNLTLLLSHTHWDHIQGLPFFTPIYQPQCRLRILGYEGARKGLVSVLSGQMESPYFPVPFGGLPGNIEIEELRDMDFHIGTVHVHAWFANHPGICVGYKIVTDKGSMAFFPDNEPHRPQRDTSTSIIYAQGEEQKMIEFLRDVDVLILDSQYDAEEYKQHPGWGHGCVDDAVTLAFNANVKQLYLFHHDPDHDDDRIDAMVEYARKLAAAKKSHLHVDAAREGLVVELSGMPHPAVVQ